MTELYEQYYRPGYGLERHATLGEHERMLQIAAQSKNFYVARFKERKEFDTKEEYDAYMADMTELLKTEVLKPEEEEV